MILAFDTYYVAQQAKTVCVAFTNWTDEAPAHVYTQVQQGVTDYEPGEFYKRELPCIAGLLPTINLNAVTAIIIDGFVVLDDAGRLGLGGHLYHYLAQRIPVIGVAKTNFAAIQLHKQEVLRGSSNRPLYITALGIPLTQAADSIKHMHGPHRIPTLLKLLDSLTREMP